MLLNSVTCSYLDYKEEDMLSLKTCQFKRTLIWSVSKHLPSL